MVELAFSVSPSKDEPSIDVKFQLDTETIEEYLTGRFGEKLYNDWARRSALVQFQAYCRSKARSTDLILDEESIEALWLEWNPSEGRVKMSDEDALAKFLTGRGRTQEEIDAAVNALLATKGAA